MKEISYLEIDISICAKLWHYQPNNKFHPERLSSVSRKDFFRSKLLYS